ncbi:MAG: ATP-grasp fold amidoligase family protein, partial [Eubacterium sp.]
MQINNKKIVDLMKRSFMFLANRNLTDKIPDETYLKLSYFCHLGRKLNLDNPTRYNEKIQWLKLYDRNPEYCKMVDKYEAKKYVANKIGEEHI